MPLTVLTGGARSGKSALAVRAAREASLPVVFIATGEARDAEFAARVALHRAARPPDWTVVEEPLELEQAIRAAHPGSFLVIDCLSLWVANLIERGIGADAAVEAAVGAARGAAERASPSIAVTNEVGCGVVPANRLARAYRDVLGRVNGVWVAAADEASLVVAGRVVRLEPWSGGLA